MKDLAIDYLGGSGFLVSLGGTGLLFDASESGPDRRALPDQAALAAFEKLYVFVSHHHDDHFPRRSTICAAKTRPIFSGLTFRSPTRACACPPARRARSAR